MSDSQNFSQITNYIKLHRISFSIASVVIVILCFYLYFKYESYYPSTDDAYVQAHIVNMAAQVSGPVAQIFVHDHQQVKKNQLLFTIDPAPFQIAVSAAKAKLKLTSQDVAGAEDAIEAAQAQLEQRKAEFNVAKKNSERMAPLLQKGFISKSEGDAIKSKLDVASAAVDAAKSQLEQAQQQLGQLGKSNAQIQAAQAHLQQAELDLAHTQITAPAEGVLVNFNLRKGAMISAGQPLFALVETALWWVDANFKETDLQRIRPQQRASIFIDLYPGVTFKGVVDQISAGSGAAFSLLPPENATGNWVKVTQRFPVRINIINPNPKYPLRVGASSSVTIDTW